MFAGGAIEMNPSISGRRIKSCIQFASSNADKGRHVGTCRRVQPGKISHALMWHDPDFQRITGPGQHKGNTAFVFGQYQLRRKALRQTGKRIVGTKGVCRLFDPVRHVWQRIDLAMWMVKRYPDFASAIFKRHDIGDIGICHQFGAADGQRIQDSVVGYHAQSEDDAQISHTR